MKNKSFISNCMDISTNECNSNWLVIICHFKSIKSYKNVPSKICFKILFWGPRTSVISILVMHVLPVAWDINLQSSNHCMAVHYSPLAMWLTHKQSKWLERVFFFFFCIFKMAACTDTVSSFNLSPLHLTSSLKSFYDTFVL